MLTFLKVVSLFIYSKQVYSLKDLEDNFYDDLFGTPEAANIALKNFTFLSLQLGIIVSLVKTDLDLCKKEPEEILKFKEYIDNSLLETPSTINDYLYNASAKNKWHSFWEGLQEKLIKNGKNFKYFGTLIPVLKENLIEWVNINKYNAKDINLEDFFKKTVVNICDALKITIENDAYASISRFKKIFASQVILIDDLSDRFSKFYHQFQELFNYSLSEEGDTNFCQILYFMKIFTSVYKVSSYKYLKNRHNNNIYNQKRSLHNLFRRSFKNTTDASNYMKLQVLCAEINLELANIMLKKLQELNKK